MDTAGKAPSNVGPSTRQPLSSGPNDMANKGGKSPNVQTGSTMQPLSRTPHPVANLENRPGMGTVQVESTRCDLARGDSDPYGNQSKIDPGYNTGINPAGGKARVKRGTKY